MDCNDTYVYVKLKKEFENYFRPVIDKYFDGYYCDVTFPITIELKKGQKKLKTDITVEQLLELTPGVDFTLPSLKIYLTPDQKPDMDSMVTFCMEIRSKKFLGEVEISIICDEKTFQAIASETYQCRHEDVAG